MSRNAFNNESGRSDERKFPQMELMFINLKILANFSQICQNEIIFRFGEFSPFLLLHAFLDISQLFNP